MPGSMFTYLFHFMQLPRLKLVFGKAAGTHAGLASVPILTGSCWNIDSKMPLGMLSVTALAARTQKPTMNPTKQLACQAIQAMLSPAFEAAEVAGLKSVSLSHVLKQVVGACLYVHGEESATTCWLPQEDAAVVPVSYGTCHWLHHWQRAGSSGLPDALVPALVALVLLQVCLHHHDI